MTLDKQLEELYEYIPASALASRLEAPLKYSPETFHSALPSLRLGGDGVVLASVILVSRHLLCEVHIDTGALFEFDYVDTATITNCRVVFSERLLPVSEGKFRSLEGATVSFVHDVGTAFQTDVLYVGDNRSAWADRVFSVIPISYVLHHSRPRPHSGP
jgi:hypothetical protein